MSENVKNYLGWTIIGALLIFAFSYMSWTRAYSQSIDPSSIRSFTVSAKGEIVAVPDVAQFTFSVNSQGGLDVAQVQTENTRSMNKIIDFLKSEGLDKKDIKTTSYNLQPRYQSFNCPRGSILPGGPIQPCPPPEIVGYNVNQSVLVKIRDFEKTGTILSGLVENGANSVSQLSFVIDDPTEVQNEARKEAIKKAKTKAKSIAKAGGFRLGKLLTIQESGPPVAFFARAQALTLDSIGEASVAPQIEPGSQEITVSVTLRYEIR